MASSIPKLQVHHSGNFVSDAELRYVDGLTCLCLATANIDELHIMLFHKFSRGFGFLKVNFCGCKINKRMTVTSLKINDDVLKFLNTLRVVILLMFVFSM